ncbi:MAG TPA: hypothetical protein VFU90_06700 [Candidatus Tumulicola sp.]|nr:hypothetical protein [Candidatus Tumulicola sp.]
MAQQDYIPKVGDQIRYVYQGVTYIRVVVGVEDRSDRGYFRLFTQKV